MQNNDDPFYTGEVYHTPQYKIDAIIRKYRLNTDAEQASSDYIYEDGKAPTSNTFDNHYVKGDDYVLPPQDRIDTPKVAPRKSVKGKVINRQYSGDGCVMISVAPMETTSFSLHSSFPCWN